jgi:hypothetical protein
MQIAVGHLVPSLDRLADSPLGRKWQKAEGRGQKAKSIFMSGDKRS